MSSIDEEFEDKKGVNHVLFVSLLTENNVVFEKSRLTKVVKIYTVT